MIEIISEVTQQLVSEFNALLPELSTSAEPLTENQLREIIDSPCTTLFVARDKSNAVVGSLTLVTFRIPTGQRAWVEDVVVSSKCRGLGIGKCLCKVAIEHAAAIGVVSIDLTSRPSRTAANRLYQKLGFAQRETNVYRLSKIDNGYRDREAPHSAPLPDHAAYGSVLRGSADQAGSDPGEQKSK